MKNETQSALVARDAAIILLLIWAFMQALLMLWAPADTQTTYLLLLFLMDIVVLCGFMDRVNTGTALAATITCGWVAYKLYSFYAVGETVSARRILSRHATCSKPTRSIPTLPSPT